MAGVKAGVLTSVDVSGPMPSSNGNGSMSLSELFHPKSAATWATIWFLVAIVFLFVL